MILKDTLKKVIKLQKQELDRQEKGTERDLLNSLDITSSHVLILSGIRRCGKSTLLKQIMKKLKIFYYFNFEDSRTTDFKVSDFEKLDEAFKELYGESKYYFFDEIQNIFNWELFVRKLQDSGKKVIITGSNASLLSKELGTRLTGRHLMNELFPFSYSEMLRFKKKKNSLDSFKDYFNSGGFPEYLKYGNDAILQQVFNDILIRDIVVRYDLKNTKMVNTLATYLFSNIGKEFSYNKLRQMLNLGSTNTVISYISYYEDSYLLFTLPKFNYSYKKQLVSPKKVYSIDAGLARANSTSFSEDHGRILENIVFLYLRQKYKHIYYFKENHECDFLIKEKEKIIYAIQVCYELTEDNKERELNGLKEAMKKFNLKKGKLITFNQKDSFEGIEVIPAWKWMTKH